MSYFHQPEPSGGELGPSSLRPALRSLAFRLLPSVLILAVCLTAAPPVWGQGRGYTRKETPTPTPRPDTAALRIQEVEEIYQGYARLFVLGHVLNQGLGLGIDLPSSMDLDRFAQQPLLSEGSAVYVFPRGKRDPLWPLVLPTPQREQVAQLPTETPTPDLPPEPMATPTPTPSPTPTEIIPPALTLQIVSIAETGPLVMISDTVLGLGDVVNDATVVQIEKRYATIEYYGKPFYVTKKGVVRPEDFREEELLFID